MNSRTRSETVIVISISSKDYQELVDKLRQQIEKKYSFIKFLLNLISRLFQFIFYGSLFMIILTVFIKVLNFNLLIPLIITSCLLMIFPKLIISEIDRKVISEVKKNAIELIVKKFRKGEIEVINNENKQEIEKLTYVDPITKTKYIIKIVR